MTLDSAIAATSDAFGAVSHCLYMVPSIYLITVAPWNLYDEIRNPPVTQGADSLLHAKLTVTGLHLLLTVLSSACRAGHLHFQVIPSTMESFDIWAAAFLVILFWINHKHQSSPSVEMSLYLACDVVTKGLFCWHWNDASIPSLFNTLVFGSLILKCMLLFLHERSKWSLMPRSIRQTIKRSDTFGFWTSSLGLWVFELLLKAKKHQLCQADLLDTPSKSFSPLLQERLSTFWRQDIQSSSLFRTCAAICQWSIFRILLLNIIRTYFKFSFAFTTASFVEYLDRSQNQQEQSSAIDPRWFAFKTFALLLGLAIANSCLTSINNTAQISTGGILSSAMADKMFTLSDRDITENVDLSLIIDNVKQAQNSYEILQTGISSYIDGFLCLYLLWNYFGYKIVLSVLSIIAAIFITNRLGNLLSKSYEKWAADAQTRASEMISSIRVLKSIKFANRIDAISFNMCHLYTTEIQSRSSYYYVAAAYYCSLVSTHALLPLIAINSTTLQSSESKLITIRCLALVYWFGTDIKSILEFPKHWSTAVAAFSRIQNFLNLPTNDERSVRFIRADHTNTTDTTSGQPLPPVQVSNATITPSIDSTAVVQAVNMSLPYGSLSIVAGDVGSGKTTLLRAISGRAPILSGSITISSDVFGFCGQDPWLQNKSIRENIIGLSEFRRSWFNMVVQACVIEGETRRFGEGYIIGPYGSKLNRSQRQRLALARAVYSKAPVLILDDVLSSQSPHIASRLITNLFSRTGVLRRGTTVVLATLKPEPFHLICDLFFRVNSDGHVSQINVANLPAPAVAPQNITADDTEQVDEPVIAETVAKLQDISKDMSSALRPRPLLTESLEPAPYSVYREYLQPTCLKISLLLLFCEVVLENFPHAFLRIWAGSLLPKAFPDAIVVGTTVLSGPFFLFSVLSVQSLIHSGLYKIHNQMLHTTLQATLSAFTSEKIELAINLFTEGLRILSRDLPTAMFQLMYITIGNIFFFFIMVSANKWAILLAPFIILTFCVVRSLYRSAAVQMQNMDLASSEKLYEKFDEVVSGLSHLESFGLIRSQAVSIQALLEDSQRVSYYQLGLKKWLTMSSDVFAAALAALYIFLVSDNDTNPFNAGIGISLCLYLTLGMGHTISNLTMLDRARVAVQQIKDFIRETPQEPTRNLTRIEGEWPSRCLIEFENVSIGYNLPTSAPLISGINFRIVGREATLCGTFQSGKTTFLLSMVAWLSYTGSIKIDGVEAREIPRSQLNSAFTVIPQDPVFFRNATIRKNLLPDEIIQIENKEGGEVVLERVLAGVGLLAVVERNGGLYSHFSTLKLSYEQRQRFSLAQGLLQFFFNPTKMALVDSVTDNVSRESLEQMTSMMNEVFRFGDCSVISTTNRPASLSTAPWLARITRPFPTVVN